MVLEAKHLSKRFGDRLILDDVELLLQPGERIGLVGPNGVGKTTLLRVLLGELAPDSGECRIGVDTRIADYEQTRATLNPDQTVYESACTEKLVDARGWSIPL